MDFGGGDCLSFREALVSKIFVVTDGDYSDYHIVGVFSTQRKAREFNLRHQGNIEEFELDQGFDFYKNGWKNCCITFDKDGNVVGKDIKDTYSYWSATNGPTANRYWRDQDHIYVNSIMAPDEETAIKIASEKRLQFLVEEEKRGKTR